MKYFAGLCLVAVLFFSCKQKDEKGHFEVNGQLSNVEDQKVFLEQLFFSQQNPQVLDTAEIKGGKFELEAQASEEGLYRVRLEKSPANYIFINDGSEISFKADAKSDKLETQSFSGDKNKALHNFLLNIESQRRAITEQNAKVDELKTTKNNDSLVTVETARSEALMKDYEASIKKTIDSSTSPVLSMFAVGNLGLEMLKTAIPELAKKFPTHQGVQGLVTLYNQTVAQQQPKPAQSGKPGIGSEAPDFSMADTTGKMVSLKTFRGKYVLVDFWASWCMPCRGENPNVVNAYNKYKGKNFTILGVSLDDSKAAWTKAIRDDKLAWTQVSDLKGWYSAAVPMYGFEGIPYNVLIDPSGKIIATELRETALHDKLAEVLK